MQVPAFNFLDFLDQNGMNTMCTQLASGCTDFVSKQYSPGLVRPDVITLAVSGQSIDAVLPPPFGIIFSGGIFATAHGNTAASDTQNYSTSFSALFPGTGSITAYLLASYNQVQQAPEVVSGPPIGHPAFDPAFTPYTAYRTLRDTLTLTASTGVADNKATFEVARCTLNAGSGAVSGVITQYQNIASASEVKSIFYVSGTTTLTVSEIGQYLCATENSGIVVTLPPAATCPGAILSFFGYQLSGNATISVNGTDQIYGFTGPGLQNYVSTVALPANGIFSLWSGGQGYWECFSINPNMLPLHGYISFTSNGNFTVPAGVQQLFVKIWGGGGGGGYGSGENGAGGGGGAGAYLESIVSVLPGSTYSVVVGVGGVPGGNGGTSSFNGSLFCSGGIGGSEGINEPGTPGGGGSVSNNADFGWTGQSGEFAYIIGTFTVVQGTGGAPFGGSQYTQTAGYGISSVGLSPLNYGVGGTGGYYNSSGGSGAPGLVTIIW